MTIKRIDEHPTVSDQVLIRITTVDSDGVPITPYKVSKVTIWFIERDFTVNKVGTVDLVIDGETVTTYYKDAIPVQVYGDLANPAWLSTDPDTALITKVDEDDEGNPLVGNFDVQWNPEIGREGDYVVCWSWEAFPAADEQANYLTFILYSDTFATTSIPTHATVPHKYEILLDRYLPDFLKDTQLARDDQTYDVLRRFNNSVAQGFTTIEDLVNQILDLQDANVISEAFLPYLANFFRHRLWSSDSLLWRRQIKRAVPLYKMKGTEGGLREALDSAGIKLQRLVRLWQVVSKSTWQEAFEVDPGEFEFLLAKTAILPPDPLNYVLYLRPVGESDYIELSLDYVSFSVVDGVTKMTWVGHLLSVDPIALSPGDIVRIIYEIAVPADQSIEDYIRTLPLADTRDETTFIYPLKNWNVRVIEEDDPLFSVIIPARHPYRLPVVWGQVRTEFAYSEKIYNMEEYNGSIRDSIDPCDIDRTFVDVCSDCQSSKISVTLEIETLDNDRVSEAEQIINEFIPFHTELQVVSYTGAINEFSVTPLEDIEMLIDFHLNESVFIGQSDFTRVIEDAVNQSGEIFRNFLSTGSVVASDTDGIGFNGSFVLYSPGVRFDLMGVKPAPNNLLEILSGPNSGLYTVSNPFQGVITIDNGVYQDVQWPLDSAEFAFNLSNQLFSSVTANIIQDDLYVFSDSTADFTLFQFQTAKNSATPWKLQITSGPYVGNYVINDLLPDDSLVIEGWPTTFDVSDLLYEIVSNDLSTIILDKSTDGEGEVDVSRRGRMETSNLQDDWGILHGDYVRYNNVDYKIISFADASTAYIENYSLGSVGGVSIVIYRRLVNGGVGFLDERGAYLITSTDYEAALDIQDGANPPPVLLENNSFRANYLIQIDSNYYEVTGWDGTRIDLSGPKINWGIGGYTNVAFSIIQFVNTENITVNDVTFRIIDRRGLEPITITTETEVPFTLKAKAAALNSGDGKGIIETMTVEESIDIEITWQDGSSFEGEIWQQ